MLRPMLLSMAALSLTICLLSPVLYFLGLMNFDDYKISLNLASLAWFFFAGWWMVMRTPPTERHYEGGKDLGASSFGETE